MRCECPRAGPAEAQSSQCGASSALLTQGRRNRCGPPDRADALPDRAPVVDDVCQVVDVVHPQRRAIAREWVDAILPLSDAIFSVRRGSREVCRRARVRFVGARCP
jgi:hypothetical protein